MTLADKYDFSGSIFTNFHSSKIETPKTCINSFNSFNFYIFNSREDPIIYKGAEMMSDGVLSQKLTKAINSKKNEFVIITSQSCKYLNPILVVDDDIGDALNYNKRLKSSIIPRNKVEFENLIKSLVSYKVKSFDLILYKRRMNSNFLSNLSIADFETNLSVKTAFESSNDTEMIILHKFDNNLAPIILTNDFLK